MTEPVTLRPLALAKQLAAIPFHFLGHQWRREGLGETQRHTFGKHPRQYLIFKMPPAHVPLRAQAIIFYHGGGWRVGWPDQFPAVGEWFLRQGYPVFLPAYRLCPRYGYPDMREDLNLALLKMLEILKINDLEEMPLVAGGMSAGATLAAHLAFDRDALNRLGLSQEIFAGFMGFGGPLDLWQLPDLVQVRNFTRGARGSSAFHRANPLPLLRQEEELPALIVHGSDDAIVPYAAGEQFYQAYPGPKRLCTIPGGSHLDSLAFALKDYKTASVLQEWLDELKMPQTCLQSETSLS